VLTGLVRIEATEGRAHDGIPELAVAYGRAAAAELQSEHAPLPESTKFADRADAGHGTEHPLDEGAARASGATDKEHLHISRHG
jgi:hypothetical protein